MLKDKKITVIFYLFLAVIFLFPNSAFAQDVFGINDFASGGVNLGTRSLRDTIAGIVNIALGFLGILATLIILYGGYTWMTSGGNADKVQKAKKIIINGIIGLVIILSSYAIARFFLTGGGSGWFGGPGGSGGQSGYGSGGGLSGGVLADHYPAINARDVARNTNIYVTFKEDMDVSFIVEDTNCSSNCNALAGYIELYEDGSSVAITGSNLLVTYDPTNPRVFQFNPYGTTATLLGSDGADVRYRMDLGNIETAAGEQAFPLVGGYSWFFTTGDDIDVTPPRVVSVRPRNASLDNPINSVIQINFSEAINPIFATGEVDGNLPDFTNISATYPGVGGPNLIYGDYTISNQYKTVEFLTADLCGQNTCGGDVYCLPGNENIGVRILAEIQDMATNRLDSDGDGVGGENPEDWYEWSFTTSNLLDLEAPDIISMEDINNVSLTDPIIVVFNKDLLGRSVNNNTVRLDGPSGPENVWTEIVGGDTLLIKHESFTPLASYSPTLSSEIKDYLQNCWYTCECNAAPGETCHCDSNTTGWNCPGLNCEVD